MASTLSRPWPASAVCCIVLQCVAVGCSGLQWVVVGCSGLQWIAVGCSGLQWFAVGCSGLQWVCSGFVVDCSVTSYRSPTGSSSAEGADSHGCCRVLQCVAVCCSVLQCVAACVAVGATLLTVTGVAVCCSSILQCIARVAESCRVTSLSWHRLLHIAVARKLLTVTDLCCKCVAVSYRVTSSSCHCMNGTEDTNSHRRVLQCVAVSYRVTSSSCHMSLHEAAAQKVLTVTHLFCKCVAVCCIFLTNSSHCHVTGQLPEAVERRVLTVTNLSCSVLQCVALCCTVLHCIAVYYRTWQCLTSCHRHVTGQLPEAAARKVLTVTGQNLKNYDLTGVLTKVVCRFRLITGVYVCGRVGEWLGVCICVRVRVRVRVCRCVFVCVCV